MSNETDDGIESRSVTDFATEVGGPQYPRCALGSPAKLRSTWTMMDGFLGGEEVESEPECQPCQLSMSP